MTKRATITPPNTDADSIKEEIDQLANTYGKAVDNHSKRSDISYKYSEWMEQIRDYYPIIQYDPLIELIDSHPTPTPLTAPNEDKNDVHVEFKSGFLRIVAADMITHAYCNDKLDGIPPKLFTQLFNTPDNLPEDISTAVGRSAFGVVHPDINYEEHILSEQIDDYAALVCHLETAFVLAPAEALLYYESILRNGHPIFDGDPTKAEGDTWEAGLATWFAAGSIQYEFGTGNADEVFTREDAVEEKAGYPHRDYYFTRLAEITDEYVEYENINRHSTVEQIQSILD